ncbi:toxin [Chitinophaga sp. Mgbs1]|uniref:Toxin n=1 Tax=Chitinophaga solisilvae TaxID=1233460 RepID=A0A433WNX0_9BACT|nr:toxin [Chitinophaga solisilvae]
MKRFLTDFSIKLNLWNIIYRNDRGKNLQALLDLDITPNKRTAIIRQLLATDYSQGPVNDTLHGGTQMWVFGKMHNEVEIYIKITLGNPGASVICISFHKAEFPMKYPLKQLL